MIKSEKRIYLHIGAPKCASSSLQEFFRLHRNNLLASGIMYPFVDEGAIEIKSGNLTGATTFAALKTRIVDGIREYPDYNLLFSTEFLFLHLGEKSNLIEFQELFKSFGYELHVIMITRDALEIGVSRFFQHSKKQRCPPTLSVFENRTLASLQQSCLVIKSIKEARVPHVIFNLKVSKPIEEFVFRSMGVEVESFTKLPRLNRAPTKSEYVMCQALAFLDKTPTTNLMNQLSMANLESEPLRLSFNSEEKQILANAINPMINHFNSLAPKHAHLDLITEDTGSESSNRAISLTELEQLFIDDDSMQIIESWLYERYVAKNEITKHFIAHLKRKIIIHLKRIYSRLRI